MINFKSRTTSLFYSPFIKMLVCLQARFSRRIFYFCEGVHAWRGWTVKTGTGWWQVWTFIEVWSKLKHELWWIKMSMHHRRSRSRSPGEYNRHRRRSRSRSRERNRNETDESRGRSPQNGFSWVWVCFPFFGKSGWSFIIQGSRMLKMLDLAM